MPGEICTDFLLKYNELICTGEFCTFSINSLMQQIFTYPITDKMAGIKSLFKKRISSIKSWYMLKIASTDCQFEEIEDSKLYNAIKEIL